MSDFDALTLLNASTHKELIKCVADVYEKTMSVNRSLAYLAVLSKFPLQVASQAAVRLLETENWMPSIARWVQEAKIANVDFERNRRYGSAIGYRQPTCEERAKQSEETRLAIREEFRQLAEAGNSWALAQVERYRRADAKRATEAAQELVEATGEDLVSGIGKMP